MVMALFWCVCEPFALQTYFICVTEQLQLMLSSAGFRPPVRRWTLFPLSQYFVFFTIWANFCPEFMTSFNVNANILSLIYLQKPSSLFMFNYHPFVSNVPSLLTYWVREQEVASV